MYFASKQYFIIELDIFVVIFEMSVKLHAELWGQTLHSGYLDRKKLYGLKTPF